MINRLARWFMLMDGFNLERQSHKFVFVSWLIAGLVLVADIVIHADHSNDHHPKIKLPVTMAVVIVGAIISAAWLLFWFLISRRAAWLVKQDEEKRRQLAWYGKEVAK